MLDERASRILQALMSEYIRTGDAVSSAELYERYDFGIKPAMIRSELAELESQGFLEQAYHSAGRIPTDRAYEWYARESLMAARPMTLKVPELPQIPSFFAEVLGAMAVVHQLAQEQMKKDGLLELVRRVDWGNRQDLAEIVSDFEEIDRRLARIEAKLAGEDMLDVFIGEKSPLTRAPNVSVFLADCWDENGERSIVAAITPKRTDYRKASQYFKALKAKYPKKEGG